MMHKSRFFPFEHVRSVQKEAMEVVGQALEKSHHVIMHAPTGLGKTAATLVPAIEYALKHNKTIFFLTSRNTQHQLAVDTVRLIKEKSKSDFLAADIIGKQWMCAVEHVDKLYFTEFSDYCKSLREEGNCIYHENTAKSGKKAGTHDKFIEELRRQNPLHAESLVESCRSQVLCPYEITAKIASSSHVIIADYHYLFHQAIRKSFLAKIRKELGDSIIIVDEAHNLPQRIRETLSSRISSNALRNAIRESKKYNEGLIEKLVDIQEVLNHLGQGLNESGERLVSRDEFIHGIEENHDYDELLSELVLVGDEIREKQHMSFVGRIASFLEAWQSASQGYARILESRELHNRPNLTLSYRCLDPSVASKEVIEASHSTIIMSGTLTPTFMYRDVLGFSRETAEECFESPFPKENRLALIVPQTTTKFSRRSSQQYRKIGDICTELVNLVPGNVALFFPSYQIRDIVSSQMPKIAKPMLLEDPKATKSDRSHLLEEFKRLKDDGAALLGVSSGSFGEGIDLPGKLLQGVVVVGMPFRIPDLETRELINYYDRKYGKGWDYGYILPAIARSLQNAGRCIRSETDKGVIVFLDERYALTKYRGCFPPDWRVEVSGNYRQKIANFFGRLQ